jgi:hypothetical protein
MQGNVVGGGADIVRLETGCVGGNAEILQEAIFEAAE